MKGKFFKHIFMILKHKWIVLKLCTKCGLFLRGLKHDLSKFSHVEFWESVKYYTGYHSPISECRKQKGYSLASLHHKHRNKHHLEYWYDRQNKEQINMPYKYAVECVCDKIAATKCYKGKDFKPEMVLKHWVEKGSKVPTGEKMKNFLTKVFNDYVQFGEKHILNKKYMKKTYNEIVLEKK